VNCCLALDRIGREGFLELEFARRSSQTILTRRRFIHPLQALEPFRASDGSLCLMMLNTSGGMVGGDRLHTMIEVGENASAVLISASASKVYRTIGPTARHEITIRLAPRATIEYLPDHLIPHAGAAYEQMLHIEMGPGSRAIVYNAMAAGRVARGERWQFSEVRSETRIAHGAHALFLSRTRILPERFPPAALGVAEHFNYLGDMIVADESRSNWGDLVSEFDTFFSKASGTRGGASEFSSGGCVARFLSEDANQMRCSFNDLWGIARRRVLNLGGIDLRRH
jgi:urease accessory protein